MKTQIIINKDEENQVEMTVNPPCPLPDFAQVMFSMMLSAMQNTLNAAPDTVDKAEVQKEVFMMFNLGASRVLELFDPAAELHPGLTEQAILEAENKIIERSYKAMPKDHKKPKKNPLTLPKAVKE